MSNQDNQKIEIRSFSLDGAKAEEGKISGRAIAFGEASRDLGGWVEVIDRDAVTLDDDLYIDFAHDSARILGRKSNGTLVVDVREDGVSFEAVPPETSCSQATASSKRRRTSARSPRWGARYFHAS